MSFLSQQLFMHNNSIKSDYKYLQSAFVDFNLENPFCLSLPLLLSQHLSVQYFSYLLTSFSLMLQMGFFFFLFFSPFQSNLSVIDGGFWLSTCLWMPAMAFTLSGIFFYEGVN